MKIIFLSILYLFVLDSFSLEWLDRSEFTDKTEGYIVEKNGDTTYGLVNIKCNGFSEDIVVETKTDIIKIDPILLRCIYKHNQTIIPLFLFDSIQLVYGIVLDTSKQFKIYQGYDWMSTNSMVTSNPNRFGTTTTFGSIASFGTGSFKTCFVVLEADTLMMLFFTQEKCQKVGKNAL